MKVRLASVLLALLVAAAPAMAMVCEFDCDAPKPGTPACHKLGAAEASVSVRDASVDCHQRHAPPDATVTNAKARDLGVDSVVALVPTPTPFVVAADMQPAAIHGPPGLNERLTTLRTTVLRI